MDPKSNLMKSKFFYLLLSTALFGCKSPNPQVPKVNIEPHDIIKSPVEVIVNPKGYGPPLRGRLGTCNFLMQMVRD
jgi:hypothetical protein